MPDSLQRRSRSLPKLSPGYAANGCARLIVCLLLGAPLYGCDETEKPRSLTPLQRLRRAQSAAPTLPPPPPPPPAVATEKDGTGPLSLGPCPLPGEDKAACPTSAVVKTKKDSQNITAAHVLIGWRGSLPGGGHDRDEADARRKAVDIAHKARRIGADFMNLVYAHSDDQGAGVYSIGDATKHRYVLPFVQAASRLAVGEVDVVRSRFGFHVVRRMADGFAAPPRPMKPVVKSPCPLHGEDPTSCPTTPKKRPTKVVVQHILIGYKGAPGRRRQQRSEAAARALTVELVHKARVVGADFEGLQKAHSDDPGDGTYRVAPDSALESNFVRRSLTLSVGNVAAVHSRLGFHVIRRKK